MIGSGKEFSLAVMQCHFVESHLVLCKKKKRFKGRLVGHFQHCNRRLIVLLPPDEFLHLQRRHALHRRERPLLAKEGTITKEFS